MLDDAQPRFHSALDDLDERFTVAGLRIIESMPRLINGFLEANDDVVAESQRLMGAVHDECQAIEDAGFRLLALQHPMGSDLRRLVALLRMCVDVDRSAALLRHVCESLHMSDPRRLPAPLGDHVRELADRAAEVFRGGMEAWRTKDALAVIELDLADEQVDRLQQLVLERAAEDDAAADDRIVLGLVARYLERIADHGVAIARDTAFASTGERVMLPSKVR
ncbi:MAG: phosphate transport system protein [Nitriliruptoraceae bacterium]|jgi:phosphate transport system protein